MKWRVLDDADETILKNITINKYLSLHVHPRMLKIKTDQLRIGPKSNYWKMLRTSFIYKYREEPTDLNIKASSSLHLRVTTLRAGLGPKVADKEIARLLRKLVSIEKKKKDQ